MIAVDTNLLVYAHREDVEWHEAADRLVAGLVEGGRPWAIPAPCLHELLAIVTHPRIFDPPTPLPLALEQVAEWLRSPNLSVLSEIQGHWDVLARLLVDGRVTGPRVHDARIAALCLEHGVEVLWSADRDFQRFPSLRVVNPLVGG